MGSLLGPSFLLLLCKHTFMWFGFRFTVDIMLPFLSLMELPVALLAASQPGSRLGHR